MIDRFDYISSVSGGSWASVLYTFLPERIDGKPVGDAQFLIEPTAPAELTMGSSGTADPGNIAYLDEHSLGTVPQRFDAETIAEALWKMWRWGLLGDKDKWRWFWIIAIGEIVLSPFELYDAKLQRRKDYPQTSHFFSESKQYVEQRLMPDNPHLDTSEFHYVRPGRTPLIVNTNIMPDRSDPSPVQIPVQATPRDSGPLGDSPSGPFVSAGSVESFAFTSTIRPATGAPDSANVTIDRRYSLTDIAGCSSAFFASAIIDKIQDEFEDVEEEITKVLGKKLHMQWLARLLRRFIKGRLQPIFEDDGEALIPAYNYWPISEAGSSNPSNKTQGFSDGGDFENSGILGALARTDATKVVSCINAGQGITTDDTTGEVVLDASIPYLFGYKGTPVDGEWVAFTKMSPDEPRSYSQVFSDAGDEFKACRDGLFAANGGGPAGIPGSAPAVFRQTLTAVANPVSGIAAGRKVDVIWIYNCRVDEWQDQITDDDIKAALQQGQEHKDGPLAHFPWYTTAGQLHLPKEAVNMLAQLSAWNVEQIGPMLEDLLG